MNYTKFHGNTFLFVNKNADEFPLPKENKEVDLTMYYKHTGNFNGVANYECTFFNKDGSEAELCGNALFRLMEQEGAGKYLFITKAGEYWGELKTSYYSDPKACAHSHTAENGEMFFKKPLYACCCQICGHSFTNSNSNASICYQCSEKTLTLKMPKAEIVKSNTNIQNVQARWFYVNTGNHHHIILHHKNDWRKVCNGMNIYEKIPEINTHIAKQKDTNTFEVRCFERGVGETQACGSGAYAVGFAMMKHFNLAEVKIVMKGGKYIVKDGFLIVKKN